MRQRHWLTAVTGNEAPPRREWQSSAKGGALVTIDSANGPFRPMRWRLFPAVAIIAIGALFLAGNLGYDLAFLDRGNWWAMVILLAAFAPLARALEIYRARGRIDAEAMCALLPAAGITLLGVLFLSGLDWGTWWPLFVILGGLFMLVPRHRRYGSRYGHDGKQDGAAIKY
jgi:hypothetical protein